MTDVLPKIIPDAIIASKLGPSGASADTLNRTARPATEQQATIAGEGALIPVCYGTRRLGAKIFAALTYQNNLVLGAVWCMGEVDSILSAQINDEALPAGVTVTHYTGTAGQTANATLVAAYSAIGQTYADALPGICYSVFVIPPAEHAGFPRLAAVVKGQKISATSGGAKAYSENPAYIIADFIESTVYGMGRAVDWATVAALASVCDSLVGGEKKRLLSLSLDTSQPGETWLQVLRDYAGAWAVPEGASYRLIPDTTGASSASFTAANILADSLQLSKRGMLETPTVIEVGYTDTTQFPWRDGAVTIYAPGVIEGTTPRRMSRVSKPGICRYSEAYRYGVERLNESILNDLSVSFVTFDAGLTVQVGDLIDVTHGIGLTAKVFRVIKIAPVAPGGRWRIDATEYDPAKYSSEVQTAPSLTDTDWPSPSNPPAMGAVTVSEELYQLETGLWSSRLRASWAASNWPFVQHYRVTVTQGNDIIDTATVERAGTTYATASVKESVQYTISVAIVSTTLAVGTASSDDYTPAGKYLAPGNVPSVTGFEAGGKVFLYWAAATDLDITRYEIRYGLTSGSWASATVVDRVDALSYVANGIPAGDWRFYVAALDSVGQYSPTPTTKDLTVTLDAGAFLLDTHSFTSPTLTNLTAYTVRPDTRTFYVSDFGDGLGYGADNTNDGTGIFGDSLANVVFCSPHTTGTATYATETWDVGQVLSGNFAFNATYLDLVGTASLFVDTKANIGDGWTEWAGGAGKATARYVRGRIIGAGAFRVESGATCRVDAFPRVENGSVTCGTGANTVALDFKYAAAKAISLTPQGTAARIVVYDNIVLSLSGTNSFDVYLFDAAGNGATGEVSWRFEGI